MSYNKYDFTEIEAGNWNVAKPYAMEMILKWLVRIGDYEEIATFGFKELANDVFIHNNNLKNTARMKAMKRLIHAISSLIRNTKFAIKKNKAIKNDVNDVEILIRYEVRLKKIWKTLPKLRKTQKKSNGEIKISIDEILFELIKDELTEMISEIHTILNKNNLIFIYTEEYDPKKVKEALKEKYINRT